MTNGDNETYCPECGTVLLPGAERCDCGWKKAPERGKAAHNHADGRCRWTSGGKRCPATGTISLGTQGGGPWYCRWHWRVTDVETGRRILEDLTANGVPKQPDWGAALIAARGEDTVSSLAGLLERLGVPRQAGPVGPKREDEALALYRDERRRLESDGVGRQQAHEQAIKTLARRMAA